MDPDRLEKTPNSFLEKPLLLDGVGDVRPALALRESVVVVVVVVADTVVAADDDDDVAVTNEVFVELLAEFSRRTSV